MIKVRMLMMSYLSDAQEMTQYMCGSSASDNINFVKYLLLKYTDTSVEVDAEKEFDAYYKSTNVLIKNL